MVKVVKTAAPKQDPASTLRVEFEYLRSTKGTHVFTEVGSEVVGLLYLKRSAVGDDAPAGLHVTIDVH